MRLDRQIVRFVAAMILAVIAYAAPSAAWAHDGHAHRDGSGAIAPSAPAPALAPASGPDGIAPRLVGCEPLVAPARHAAASAMLGAGEGGRCCGGCGTACRGTMPCCASAAGILAGAAALPVPPQGTVRPAPPTADGLADAWLEALPEPPRTRA